MSRTRNPGRPPAPRDLRNEGRLPATCPICGGPGWQEPPVVLTRPDGTREERRGPVRCSSCERGQRRCRLCRQSFRAVRSEVTCPACLAAAALPPEPEPALPPEPEPEPAAPPVAPAPRRPDPVECPGCRAPLEQLLEDCYLCRDCALIRFGDAARMADIAASISDRQEILECFREDTRRGARGRSPDGQGRRKPPPPRRGPRYSPDDAWGGVSGPWGRPDPPPPPDYGRATSKVVSLRLAAQERAQLERLAERHGSPASAVRAGLAALEALDYAREAQGEPEQLAARRTEERWSTTRIAETLGVSEPTVRRDLEECSGSSNDGTEQTPAPIQGTDGKQYPASRPEPEQLAARRIAQETGVSHVAVREAVQVESGLTPEHVTGQDGKTYPAQREPEPEP